MIRAQQIIILAVLVGVFIGLTAFIVATETDPLRNPMYKPIRIGSMQIDLNGLHRDDFDRILFGAAIAAGAVALLSWLVMPKDKIWDSAVFLVLLATAAVSTAAAISQYAFIRERYFDAGDLFHYYLGPKYLAELGYEDFYTAALVAQRENGGRMPRHVRDLRTNKVHRIGSVLDQDAADRIHTQFSADRWRAFKQDMLTFRQWHGDNGWQRRFSDHGYNATPIWNFFAAQIAKRVPITHHNLTLISLLNAAFILLMFAVVVVCFDWRLALLFITLFWVNYPDRYLLGGALLRYAWISLLVLGLCCMRIRRFGWAGFFLAFAAGLIVFPILFFTGMAAKWVDNLAKGRPIPRGHKRFLATAILTLTVLFGLSLTEGQGLRNWTGFKRQMDLNSGRLATGRIGFIYNFIWPKEVDRSERQMRYEPRVAAYKEAKGIVFSLQNVRFALTALIILMILGLTDKIDELNLTVLLGFSLFFLLFSTVRYYYAGLAGLPFLFQYFDFRRGDRFMILLLFLLILAAYLLTPHTIYSFIYNTVLSAGFTVFIMLTLVYLYLRREPGDEHPAKANTSLATDEV